MSQGPVIIMSIVAGYSVFYALAGMVYFKGHMPGMGRHTIVQENSQALQRVALSIFDNDSDLIISKHRRVPVYPDVKG
jgi:hypothetical protein